MRSKISLSAVLASILAIAAVPAPASAEVDPNTAIVCQSDGVGAFKWSVLKGPRNAEKGKTSSASLLRKIIRGTSSMPRSRWFVTATGKSDGASFIQYAHGPIDGLTTITLTRKNGAKRWKFSRLGRGHDCDPRVLTSSGIEAAPWYSVPDKLPINPTARSVQIAVDIQGCGDDAKNVFVDAIKYSSTEVRIRVEVRPSNNQDLACTAELRPPTEYKVALSEPIAKRSIVDIARAVPRTRASADQLAAVRAGADPLEVLLFRKSNAKFCKDVGPSVYTIAPTKGQVSRWHERAAKSCPWAATGL